MIKITGITITDFGRHKRVHQRFNGHVIGLCGPNGLGKSTVLQALQFALTGSIDTVPVEPLRNFIRNSSGDKPPKAAEVVVEFVADGKKGKITRRITPTTNTRKLEWEGLEAPITAEAKVAEVMFQILGVDKKAINSTVFIRQGETASMFGKDADRRDFYTKLLMLGHLDKVADVIDVHRKHQADSVQDLGAAMDAANATYREAEQYFNQSEEVARACPSQEQDLAAVRSIIRLFDDHAAAEEALSSAATRLRGFNLDPETNPEGWLELIRSELNRHHERLEVLAKRRTASLKARAELAEAEKAMKHAQETVQKFNDLAAANEDLARLGDLGENPAGVINACNEKLRKFKREAELAASIPDLRSRMEAADVEAAKAESDLKLAQEAYEKLRDDYRDVSGGLAMRKEIQKGIEAAHQDASCGCLVCGSKSPDNDYLTRTIAELETRVAKLKEEGTAAKATMDDLSKKFDLARRKTDEISDTLARDIQEHKRLKLEMSLTTKEAVERDLADAEEKLQAYAAKEFEHRRLRKLVSDREALVKHLRMPTDNEIDALTHALHSSQEEAGKATWSSKDELEESEITPKVRELRRLLDEVTAGAAAYDAAKTRLGKAEEDLSRILSQAPTSLFSDVHQAGTALTVAEVRTKLERLESAQKSHDEARGRMTAANEALKAASRRIEELDLRIAEQKHRLKLVEDLKRLRDTFKPDGASLEYLNYKFGKIARMAADYLAESGADFMVAASAEVPLAFEFLRTDRADEAWMSQNRLSGGQKVRLAVATLRAIHAMIMPEVGLMVLDEPTTHLDTEVQRSMADMLHKIGEEGTLQMVICDHSQILIDAFSDVIDLESA
jgi:exonuclease SbcC